jgi:hypothetical protein
MDAAQSLMQSSICCLCKLHQRLGEKQMDELPVQGLLSRDIVWRTLSEAAAWRWMAGLAVVPCLVQRVLISSVWQCFITVMLDQPYINDQAGNNHGLCRVWGCSAEQLLGNRAHASLGFQNPKSWSSRAQTDQMHNQAQSTSNNVQDKEAQCKCINGHVTPIQEHQREILPRSGGLLGSNN